MLHLTIPGMEKWDEKNEEFVVTKTTSLTLEHSLVSISKWESKWHKPFLGKEEKSLDEIIDYVKCMTITQNVPDSVYGCLTADNLKEINKYIDDPMTAVYFYNDEKGSSRETVTNELIYYWMISLQIPFECQKWHINRLLTLIKVCNKKNAPPKSMSKAEIMSRNARLNAERKAKLHTKG